MSAVAFAAWHSMGFVSTAACQAMIARSCGASADMHSTCIASCAGSIPIKLVACVEETGSLPIVDR
jgi:hypothetical protein